MSVDLIGEKNQVIELHFNFRRFIWLRIADEDSVPETSVWFILLIASDYERMHPSECESHLCESFI